LSLAENFRDIDNIYRNPLDRKDNWEKSSSNFKFKQTLQSTSETFAPDNLEQGLSIPGLDAISSPLVVSHLDYPLEN